MKLRELRTSQNKSQQDIANILGITRQAYNNYELGYREPGNEMLLKLADYFNVSLDYLFGRTIPAAKINSHNTIQGNNNIIGNGNKVGEALSEQEFKLLNIFRSLDVVAQAKLLVYAAELEKEV